ncbi:MAG: hypothetical protein NTU81_00510 [Candidatus Nomurabacteria bacterium]|nr:hypothetical protein [Candidatus Nomurabacteria bacterium]
MRTYFTTIKYLQETLLALAIVTMMVLPSMIVFSPDIISNNVVTNLYLISHIFLFFVMIIRPLADIFTKTIWIRPLVILRKGAGVMSASIVVSFILAKLMVNPVIYFSSIATLKYWSMVNYAVLAHIADISAVILIITSNNFSKSLFGNSWKTIQKLAYVYFYGSVLYVFLTYGSIYLLVALVLVTITTYIAFIKNSNKKQLLAENTAQNII